MFATILKYIPATIIPAATSFLIVFVFTRHLTPTEFGDYNFALSASMIGTTTLFWALPTITEQMLPAATKSGSRDVLLKTAYSLMQIGLLCLAVIFVAALLIAPARRALPPVFWLALPMTALRGVVSMNQSMNQIDAKLRWFSLIECSQALIGFGAATAFVLLIGPTAVNLLAGLTLGFLISVVADWRATLRGFRRAAFDRAIAGEIMRQAAPLTMVLLLGALLLYSDRFVLESLSTSYQLGLYAAAAALADRPLATLCITVTAGLYPLAVRRLGFHGEEAGRTQLAANMLALISVGLPASVGLALLSQPIANVLVGPQFRAGAAALLPAFAIVSLLRSLNVHCFDHAFYLARRSRVLLWVYAPVTAVNIALSIAAVPFIGVYGTLMSALVSQVLLVFLELRAIQRVFPLPIQYGELGKVVVATAAMAGAVLLVPARSGWENLAAHIAVGAVVYAVLFVMLNVLDIRGEARPLIERLMPSRRRPLARSR